MRECPQMAWIIERLGEDLSESEREEIVQHLSNCPGCARQLQRMARLAPAIAEASGDLQEPGQHLSDNDLAAFAAHGYDAEGASAIALHLSQCRRCRDAFTAAHTALVRYEAAHQPPPWWRAALDDLLLAMTTLRGVALMIGAIVLYLAECLLFAVAAGQMILAWAIPPAGYEAVPAWWPLTLVPTGPGRLVLLVILCVALALAARSVAGALFAAARAAAEGRAP
ncbi:MAG: zf-HC2 domain-containing protein [Armatimonadota bacterium]